MKVIVPCCGLSTRFPGQAPKWLLPAHDGRPMLCLAISGLEMSLNDLVVTILREHESAYQVTAGLEKAFGRPVCVVVLDEQTRSQADTVDQTLAALGLDEPFLVKDSDGYFTLDHLVQDDNYVCVESLNNFDSINPRNKSYLQVDMHGIVTNIREKVVISDLFNVGGYYFTSPEQFRAFYRRLSRDQAAWDREIYISDVIGAMILQGIPFRTRRTQGYKDWGTIREWQRALLDQKAYFVLLDGFVFERGSEFFSPLFGDVRPNPAAVEAVRSLAAKGHHVTYLSIRPETLADQTLQQMRSAGLPCGSVVWNCPAARWVLLTAPHATLPFVTSQAIELHPDDPNLTETIEADSGH